LIKKSHTKTLHCRQLSQTRLCEYESNSQMYYSSKRESFFHYWKSFYELLTLRSKKINRIERFLHGNVNIHLHYRNYRRAVSEDRVDEHGKVDMTQKRVQNRPKL